VLESLCFAVDEVWKPVDGLLMILYGFDVLHHSQKDPLWCEPHSQIPHTRHFTVAADSNVKRSIIAHCILLKYSLDFNAQSH